MPDDPEKAAPRADSDSVRRVWNANAGFWDSQMGEGNEFHLRVLLPSLERLLALRAGDRALEIACGNGQLARWMARHGASVVATDLSDQLIERARRKPAVGPGRVDLRVVDASDEAALRALGSREFDVVVCNMALMDMPEIEPLARALPELLGPGGRFVFSVTHPCFNRSDSPRVARWSDEGGVVRETVGLEIRAYLTPRAVEGVAVLGQPLAQSYFERPIELLLAPFLRAGLVLDALEEPTFPATEADPASPPRPWFSWSRSLREIPPALVARMVRGGRIPRRDGRDDGPPHSPAR